MADIPMTLETAMHVLCRAHTRDNHYSGFVVESTYDRYSVNEFEYIEAWKVLRQACHMQVDPQE